MTIKKYITLALTALTLAGCASDDANNSLTEDRLPLTFETSLSGSRTVTRAIGNQFEANDELLCYVRHISSSNLSTDKNYQEVSTYKKMVTINKNGEPTVKQYWDDYSDSNNDLRTKNHALQSFYGYCYNGGTPSPALVEATGVLGWTTAVDQTADGAMKANDLLWSAAQEPVTYQHAKEGRSGLTIPYTHAMSKFTIVVVAGEGFKADDLNATTVTLDGMNLKGTFTAPTAKVEATGTTTVKMFANAASTTTDNKPCRAYEAVVVPTTALSLDKHLATISDVDGNDYEIHLTNNILSDWATGIDNDASKSGYNYKLTVTLNKQAISVVASLAGWTDVSATGTGEINFAADVTSIDKSNSAALKNGDSFSLWMTTDLANIGSVATTAEYNGSKFVNSPAIYWPNGSDNFYFRALAKKTIEHALGAVTSANVSQGTDLLWATTAAHTGTEAGGSTTHDYAEGAAINPRTGDVPLTFRHVMSNVVINLTTSSDASAVDLTGAKITLTNLYNDGSIDIASGDITHGSAKAAKAVKEATDYDLIMIPQTIDDNSKLIITLTDGTTYSLQLNKCTDKTDGTTLIADWKSGNMYTYTITLKKEEVSFRALIQEWTKNPGSGNATLDWD
ncbi:fimbrillin family protein [Xylanibacter ruminicola]|uniref:Fimbrillin-like n=1 Tax=Xylanibacter ruminicola TaxID=839 RepID=A0A1M6UJD3_XYLRU|nr:fimbrillin family protein [Xylanibacter ruminicola]SHK69279.1 Fimbrillin-like [Xylanibacter ruminicola]